MVKPSAIYYNSVEVLKDIPSRAGKVRSMLNETGYSSTSEDRPVNSPPSTPTPSLKFKSPKSTFSAQDAVFGDLVDTARVVALEDSLRVSN